LKDTLRINKEYGEIAYVDADLSDVAVTSSPGILQTFSKSHR
jgi:hypothetical protein